MLNHPARLDLEGAEPSYGITCKRLDGARRLRAAAGASGRNDKVGVEHILDAPRISTYGSRFYGLMLVERGQAKWDQNDVDGARREFSLISKFVMNRHEDVAARVFMHQANVTRRDAYQARACGDGMRAAERCELAISLAAYAAKCAEAAGDPLLQADCTQASFYARGLKATIEGAGAVRFDRLTTGVMLAIKGRDGATPPIEPPGLFGPTCLADLALQSSCPTPSMLADLAPHDALHQSAFRAVFGAPTPGSYAGWLLDRTREHLQHPGHRPLSAARALVFVARQLAAGDFERAMQTQIALLELVQEHQRYRDAVQEAFGYEVPLLPGVNKALARVAGITGMPPNRRLYR